MRYTKHIIRLALLTIIVSISGLAYAQDTPIPYQIYDREGKLTDWKTLLKASSQVDVVFFGELHNQSQVHWLQLQLAKALYNTRNAKVQLGYEMIETDRQAALDSLSDGTITEGDFAQLSRLWPNYDTDYKPIVDWGIKHKIKQVATNCPRKYASMVHKQGMESLLALEPATKRLLAPLPYLADTSLAGYKAMLTMMGGHGQRAFQMVQAQALKDATMASRVAQYHKAGHTMLHLNGSYHSDNYEGILAHLPRARQMLNLPALSVVTISTIQAEADLSIKDKRITPQADKKADFYLVIPPDAPASY